VSITVSLTIEAMHYPQVLLSWVVPTADGSLIMAPQKPRYRADRSCDGKESEQSPCHQNEAANDTDVQAFERWLNEKLEALYGPVVNEPIPEEWLRIIEKFDKGAK
jgi:hypothetical protein